MYSQYRRGAAYWIRYVAHGRQIVPKLNQCRQQYPPTNKKHLVCRAAINQSARFYD